MKKQQDQTEQVRREIDERELDKLLCPGCRDGLLRQGEIEPMHMWLDGSSMEPCTVTPERKKALREYFEKDIELTRRANANQDNLQTGK